MKTQTEQEREEIHKLSNWLTPAFYRDHKAALDSLAWELGTFHQDLTINEGETHGHATR